MKLFSFRMRAISVFTFDTGMSTRRCFDPHALRIRVSISAIGSVMLMSWSLVPIVSRAHRSAPETCRNESETCGLPARLAHARDHPGQRQVADADTAKAELAQERARAAAAAAAVVLPDLKLRLPLGLLDHGLPSHTNRSVFVPECR